MYSFNSFPMHDHSEPHLTNNMVTFLWVATVQATQLQLSRCDHCPVEHYCHLYHADLCHSSEWLAAADSQQFSVSMSYIHKALDRACFSLSWGNEELFGYPWIAWRALLSSLLVHQSSIDLPEICYARYHIQLRVGPTPHCFQPTVAKRYPNFLRDQLFLVQSGLVYRARPILSLAGSWGRGVGKSERRSSRCY